MLENIFFLELTEPNISVKAWWRICNRYTFCVYMKLLIRIRQVDFNKEKLTAS